MARKRKRKRRKRPLTQAERNILRWAKRKRREQAQEEAMARKMDRMIALSYT